MKKYILAITSLCFAVAMTSCEDWLDVNTDPNNPTEVTPDLILPVAQHYTARYIQVDRGMSHLGNMLMQNWSESAGFSWYNDEFAYLVSSTFYDQLFDNAYSLSLKQYAQLDDLGDEYGHYRAISMIMKAYHFQLLVDTYGDIPYADALGRSANPTPAYNDGQEVYDNLITDLTNAIALINTTAALETAEEPGADDVIYGGDMDAWKRFANSIKLRILTRESDVKDSGYITAELAAIAAEGSGYIGADVTVNPGYVNQENQQNALWEDFGAGVDGTVTLSGDATCASDFIINYLQDTHDPRIDFLYEEPTTGHLGVPQGITSDPATQGPALVSNIGPGLLIDATQDARIMTMAEVNFNLAELALKGFGGDPETLYNAGIAASFSTLGAGATTNYLDPAMAVDDNLLPLENVVYASATNKLEAIITQKWIAMNGITAEQSWFDYNRTGFPSNLPTTQETNKADRPVRMMYPASEVGGNTANLPSQPDAFTSPIFWAN